MSRSFNVYKVAPTTTCGVDAYGELVTGLKLESHILMGFDPLEDMLENEGVGAVEIPENLSPGQLYKVVTQNRVYDSDGNLEDWCGVGFQLITEDEINLMVNNNGF